MNSSSDIIRNNQEHIELGKLMLNKRVITQNFTKAYFNTNEHIDKTLDYFDIEDKRVLTVMGSGEQVFYSLLHGASAVDTFDMNVLTYYLYTLKAAAILSLNREEYLKFFPIIHTKNDHFFSPLKYLKVRKNLNYEERKFWDKMFKNGFSKNHGRFSLFSPAVKDVENPYYSKDNYPILKEKLETGIVTFHHANLMKLPSKIKLQKNSYSAILLSNIYDWLPIQGEDYNDFLEEEILPLLKDDGICLARYIFRPNKNYSYPNFETKTVHDNNKEVASVVLTKKRII